MLVTMLSVQQAEPPAMRLEALRDLAREKIVRKRIGSKYSRSFQRRGVVFIPPGFGIG